MTAKLFTTPEGRLPDAELWASSPHISSIWGEGRKLIEKTTYRSLVPRGHKSVAGFFPSHRSIVILSYPRTSTLEEALKQTTNNYALTAAFSAEGHAKEPSQAANNFGYIAHNVFNVEIPEFTNYEEFDCAQ